MNPKQIAFIICVNDLQEYSECKNYIDRLKLPNGYTKDVLVIQEASSMAEAYNAAMQASDAKYKVYLHQDVFIRNEKFIENIIHIFRQDSRIGALGMVGAKKLSKNALAIVEWDTGKLLSNIGNGGRQWDLECGNSMEVEAVDGLLIATQYDLPWREDLFDGWDFYDISQCMEFLRAGYKVVVPEQEEAWCYHDNGECKMTDYDKYRSRFCEEYKDIRKFEMQPLDYDVAQYEKKQRDLKAIIANLLTQGEHAEIQTVFSKNQNRGWDMLKEYELIADIDELERNYFGESLFWKDGENAESLVFKLRNLKYLLKRVEFGVDSPEENMRQITENYSVFALALLCRGYAAYKEKVFQIVLQYYQSHGMIEAEIWKQMETQL